MRAYISFYGMKMWRNLCNSFANIPRLFSKKICLLAHVNTDQYSKRKEITHTINCTVGFLQDYNNLIILVK